MDYFLTEDETPFVAEFIGTLGDGGDLFRCLTDIEDVCYSEQDIYDIYKAFPNLPKANYFIKKDSHFIFKDSIKDEMSPEEFSMELKEGESYITEIALSPDRRFILMVEGEGDFEIEPANIETIKLLFPEEELEPNKKYYLFETTTCMYFSDLSEI